MKTFLWATLFWIIVAIAWLLCLGFWNLWTQVLDNWWVANFIPKNLQEKFCDPLLTSTIESIDWCAAAEANNCYPAIEDNEVEEPLDDISLQDSLQNIIANQQVIYSYLQESFASTNQAINSISLSNAAQSVEEPVIDEKEQQRLELQAQIEALQNEMANLY